MDAGAIIALCGSIATPVILFMGWVVASLLRIERLVVRAVATDEDHENRIKATEADLRALQREVRHAQF